MKTGKVIEFYNEDIEALKSRIAEELGYKLIDHRLELFAVPSEAAKDETGRDNDDNGQEEASS